MKNKVKQILSIAMTVCMLSTMVPLTTYGADVDFSDDAAVTVESEEDNENGEETTDSAEVEISEDEQTDENADVLIEEDETQDESEDMFSSDESLTTEEEVFTDSVGSSEGAKPVDGVTQGQPFAAGTAGSQNFRIPSMVTLSNGIIVAAADMRWDTTADAGGLDTIVARSTDNGATWNYTVANYMGDNGNKYNSASTAFIDPALATDGQKVYMLVDLFPGGVGLNNANTTPKAGTGFNDAGYLMLTENGKTSYEYYYDSDNGYICKNDGTVVADYTVDKFYNLYKNGEKVSNLFYADSPYNVFPTNYLYFTVSEDSGATWSEPIIINNNQVRNSGETFYGVGPGRGLVLSDGIIAMPCYSYDGNANNQRTSFIYSTDQGKNWTRVANATGSEHWSSESAIVQINDETVRSFYRDGYSTIYYTDYVYKDGNWTTCEPVNLGITKKSNNQLSAIKYSKQINGNTVIFISTATAGQNYDRRDGKIYAFALNDDNTMKSIGEYAVNSGTYQYSSLAEMANGNIGLLYENGAASIVYSEIPVSSVVKEEETPVDTGNGTEESPYNVSTEVSLPELKMGESIYLTAGEDAEWTISGTNLCIEAVDAESLEVQDDVSVQDAENNQNVNAEVVEITAVSEGDATITASTDSTTYEKTIKVLAADNSSDVIGNLVTIENTPFVGGANYIRVKSSSWSSDYSNKDSSSNAQKITKLTVSVGVTFDVDILSGTNVIWSSANSQIASVGSDGTVKGVSAGETTITAVIDGIAYSMPVVVTQGAGTTTDGSVRWVDFYISNILNTTVYYSRDCSSDLIEAKVGEVFYVTYSNTDPFAVDFFGKPNEGYALTRMSATDSAGEYFALDKTTDVEKLEFYTKGPGTNQANTWGLTKLSGMIQKARDNSCDGVMGFTRLKGDTNNIRSSLVFESEKLPTVKKEVEGILGTSGNTSDYREYQEGMSASVGETVYFKVTVTQYETQDKEYDTEKNKYYSSIRYSNVMLTDKLDGAVFNGTTSSTMNITSSTSPSDTQLNNSIVSKDRELVYYVAYTIQDKDLDTTITNIVDFSFNYKAAFSSGTFASSAEDSAIISALKFKPKNIVIDFGIPVKIDYSGKEAHGRYDLEDAEFDTTYGKVEVKDNVVTYTPVHVLEGTDTVTIKNIKEASYSFKVYPATTVYYEEEFAENTEHTSTDMRQQDSAPGSGGANYGYDAAYKNGTGSAVNLLEDGAKNIQFKGTGVDIYANTTTNTGTMMIKVKNSENKVVKVVAVDTKMANGEGAPKGYNQEVSGKNIPVATLDFGTYDEYTANISCVKSGSAGKSETWFDGFRVYNTLTDSYTVENVYKQDGEANPVYCELRDQVLSGLSIDTTKSQYANQIGEKLHSQVYDMAGKDTGAVVISDAKYTDVNSTWLLDNGPKNELYLAKNQSVVFSLKKAAQIGIKGVNGNTTYDMAIDDSTVKSGESVGTADMFYPVKAGTVVITNKGDNLLSITKIKAFNVADATSLFAPLTEESLTAALVGLGYEKAPEPTATATPTPTVTTAPTQKPAQQIKLATPKLGKVVSAGYNALKLNWSKVKGADGYRVYVKVNGKWNALGNTKSTTYVHKKLETGKSYTYTVKAYKNTKSGTVWSSYDKKGITGKTALKAPSLRQAKRTSAKKATLSWKKVDGANGYVVYRKTNNGRWQIVKKITKGNITSFTDKKLSKGKKYTYTVRAYRTVGKKNIYSGYNKKGLNVK